MELLIKKVTYPGVRPDRYLVTNTGWVYDAIAGKPVNLSIDKDGYFRTDLVTEVGNPAFYKRVAIHRLVGWEFCPGRDMNLTIDHIDGNKKFNWSSNLRWVTSGENTRAAEALGLRNVRGEANGHSKYPEAFVRLVCKEYEKGRYPLDIYRDITGSTLVDDEHRGLYIFLYNLKNKTIWPGVVKDYSYETDTRDPKGKRTAIPGRQGKFTEATIRQICELLQNGIQFAAIVDMVKNNDDCKDSSDKQLYDLITSIWRGRSWTFISKDYTFQAGFNSTRLRLDDIQEEINLLEKQGMSYREIADTLSAKYGKNKKHMRKQVKRYLDLKSLPDAGVKVVTE